MSSNFSRKLRFQDEVGETKMMGQTNRQREAKILFITVIALTLIAPITFAIPNVVDFQGKLYNSMNQPQTGTFNITFSLYNQSSGGTLIWRENRLVGVSSGLFSVLLGSNVPFTTNFNEDYYLEVNASGEVFAPRYKLASVPYALRANLSEGAISRSASTPSFVITGLPSQSANLLEWRDASNNLLAYVNASGVFFGSGAGLTNINAGSFTFLAENVVAGTFAQNTNNGSFVFPSGVKIKGSLNVTNITLANNCQDGQVLKFLNGVAMCGSDLTAAGGSYITGAGIAGYLALWNETSMINASVVFQNGTNIGIGTTSPTYGIDLKPSSLTNFFRIARSDVPVTAGYFTISDYTVTPGVMSPLFWAKGNSQSYPGVGFIGDLNESAISGTNPIMVFEARANSTDSATRPLMSFGGYDSLSTPSKRYITINASGGIGIGTPTPIQKLDVNGSVNINGNITMPSSFFIGYGANTADSYATAVGYQARANNTAAISIGYQSLATRDFSIAIGANSNSASSNGNAIGRSTYAAAGGTALGYAALSVGNEAFAIGNNANATGGQTLAIGKTATAISDYSTAIGYLSTASTNNALAIGREAQSTGGGIGIGPYASSTGSNAITIGPNAVANSTNSNAFGYQAQANGSNSISIGYQATTQLLDTIAIGTQTNATGSRSLAMGRFANSGGVDSIAIGNTANASGVNGIAIGLLANASTLNSISIGQSASSEAYGIALGRWAYTGNQYSLAIGSNSNTTGISSIAIGDYASVPNNGGTAVGSHAVAINGAAAFGAYTNATGAFSRAFGNYVIASGSYSTAIGVYTNSTAQDAFAEGRFASALQTDTIAIGRSSLANSTNGIAIGPGAQTANSGRIAIGESAYAGTTSAVAIGPSAQATGSYNSIALGASANAITGISIGAGSQASGGVVIGPSAYSYGGVAIGDNANGTARWSTVIGYQATVFGSGNGIAIGNSASGGYGWNQIAIGAGAQGSDYSVAIGSAANTTTSNAVAIGRMTNASYANSVALGPYAATTAANQFMVGGPGSKLDTVIYGSLNVTNITLALNCADGQVLKWANGVGTCGADTTGSGVQGSGSAGYIALWNETNVINSSAIFQNGTRIGIGTTSPADTLDLGTGFLRTNQSGWTLIVNGSTLWPTAKRIGAIGEYNGRLYIGTKNDSTGGDVWVYDGKGWSLSGALGYGTTTGVDAMAVYNNKLYATISRPVTSAVSEFNGTGWLWMDTGSGISDALSNLAVYNGKLYAAGGYSSTRRYFFEFNGTNWAAIYTNNSGGAFLGYSSAVYNGKLYVGRGGGGIYNASVWTYDGKIVREKVADFNQYQNVFALAAYNGKLYAGMQSITSGMADIWTYDGSAWNLDYRFPADATFVQRLFVYAGKLYASVNGTSSGGIYVRDGGEWKLALAAPSGQYFSAIGGGANGKLYAGLDGPAGTAHLYEFHDRLEGQLYQTRPDYVAGVGEGSQHFTGNVSMIGSLGVGTSTPSAKLEVAGNILQTPPTPKEISNLTANGYGLDIQVVDDTAYLANSVDYYIIDVKNISSPRVISWINMSADYTGWSQVIGRYAYVGNGPDLNIFDISDVQSPRLVGNVSVGGSITGGYVQGKYAYIAKYTTGGLWIVDIADPTSPRVVGTLPVSSGLAYSVYVKNNIAYVGANNAGFCVANVTDPTSPTWIGGTCNGPNARYLDVQGGYAYVGGTSGLRIVDLRNLSNLTTVRTVTTNNTYRAQLYGKYLYAYQGSQNVSVYDVSNMNEMPMVARYQAPDATAALVKGYVAGRYMYVADYAASGGLRIFDLGGIDTPTISTGSLKTTTLDVDKDAFVSGNAFVGSGIMTGIGGIQSQGPISIATPGSNLSTKAFEVSNSNGSKMFFVRNDGNVSIGAASPTQKLHVNGSVRIDGNITLPEQFAIGYGANVVGANSLAIGSQAQTTQSESIAIGYRARGNGIDAVVIGPNAEISNSATVGAVAIGQLANVSMHYSTSVGFNATSNLQYDVSIGAQSYSDANYGVAIGSFAHAGSDHGIAIGGFASSPDWSPEGAIAIGYYANASMHEATALGYHALASGWYSNAIGFFANASHQDTFVIGRDAVTTSTNQFVVGSATAALNTKIFGSLNATNITLANNCADGQVLKWANGVGTCGTDTTGGNNGNVSAIGSTGYIAQFQNDSGTIINNSIIFQNGTKIGIGTTNPAQKLDVQGSVNINGNISMPDNFFIGNGGFVGLDGGIGEIALGTQANASDGFAISIGYQALSYSTGIAIGAQSSARASSSVAIGTGSETGGTVTSNAVAIGNYANVSGDAGIAIGNLANAAGIESIAMGSSASASNDNSIALGKSAVTTASNQLVVGSSGVPLNTKIYGSLNATNILLANNCADGQVLKWNGGVGTCGTDNTVAGNSVYGSGVQGYLALWNETSVINASSIYQSGARIGIGTTNLDPYAALTVGTTPNTNGVFINGSGTGVPFRVDANTNLYNTIMVNYQGYVGIHTPGVYPNALTVYAKPNENGLLVNLSGSGVPMRVIANNNVEGLTVDNSGNIGIGAISPGNRLDVNGSVTISGNLTIGPNSFWIGNGGSQVAGTGSMAIGQNARGDIDYAVAIGYGSSVVGAGSDYSSVAILGDVNGTRSATILGTVAGSYSTAIGYGSSALTSNGIALGTNAAVSSGAGVALGYYTNSTGIGTAVGSNALATGGSSTGLGRYANASGQYSIAISAGGTVPTGAQATAQDTIAIGRSASANNTGGVAIGYQAGSYNTYSTALGYQPRAVLTGTVALGYQPNAEGSYSIAIGQGSNASSQDTISIGRSAKTTDINAVSIGYNTNTAQGGVAIGVNSNTAAANSIAIGNAATAPNGAAVAIDWAANASGASSIAVGNHAASAGLYSIALGYYTQSLYQESIAIGRNVLTDGSSTGAVAIGGYTNATNSFATAIGYNANAVALGSLALGYQATASNQYTVALGYNSAAYGSNSVALGMATSAAANAIAIGQNTDSSGGSTVAIGNMANASGLYGVAIGASSNATNQYGVSVGQNSASGTEGVAIGANAIGLGMNSVQIGSGARTGSYGTALGYKTNVSAYYGVAIGYQSNASYQNSAALGEFATTTATNQFVVGSGSNPLNTKIYGSLNATNITLANNCADGQVLKWANGVGTCGSDSTGNGVQGSGVQGYLALWNETNVINASIVKQQNNAIILPPGNTLYTSNITGGIPGAGAVLNIENVGNPIVVNGSWINVLPPIYFTSTITGGASGNQNILTLDGWNGGTIFKTQGVERMRILSTNGNVGINTATPGQTLDVNGSATIRGTLNVSNVTLANNCADGQVLKWQNGVGVCGADTTGAAGGNVSSSGSTGYIPQFQNDSGTIINNSIIFQNGTNIGIGTTSPSQKLDIRGSVNINGNVTMPTSFFIGNGASVAGASDIALGSSANANNTGGIAIGYQAGSNNTYSTAIGYQANAYGSRGVALGSNSLASAAYGIAIGYQSISRNAGPAVGYNAQAVGTNSVSYGVGAESQGDYSLAIGSGPNATGQYAISIGQQAFTSGTGGIAMGRLAQTIDYGIAIGALAQANATYSIALGANSNANASYAIAIGNQANATAQNSIAIGKFSNANTTTTSESPIAVGISAYAEGAQASPIAIGKGAIATATGAGVSPIAIGRNAEAKEASGWGIAIGDNANASTGNGNAIAIGGNTLAGSAGVALGANSKNFGANGVAIGFFANTSTQTAAGVALGYYATAMERDTVAIGSRAYAYSYSSMALGSYAKTYNGYYATAVGYDAMALEDNAIALGKDTNATAINSTAFGTGAFAGSRNAMAIGAGTNATFDNSTAFGYGATTTAANQFMIGSSAAKLDTIIRGSLNVTNISLANNCADGQILKWANGVGTCGSDNIVAGNTVYGSGSAGYIALWNETSVINASVVFQNGTNIGIGTTAPTQKLDVNGNVKVNGDLNVTGTVYQRGADIAENIKASGNVEAGDVVVIDEKNVETVRKSTTAYDTKVAGVVSTDPATQLGMKVGGVPLALAGRVPVKVTNENGSIAPGDLLTTSSRPGYAMKCNSRSACAGAIIGKALDYMNSKEGKITVLISLG